MIGQSEGDHSFRSATSKWSKDVESILHCELSVLRENSCLQGRAKILMALMENVGEVLRSFLKKFPKMEAAACNVLLFGGATFAMADLFLDLVVIRVQKTITSSSVFQAKAFAQETFLYVKPRLEELDVHGQDFDRTDHQRTNIQDCIGKLVEVKSVVDRCISKLNRYSVVASLFSVIFGLVGVAGLAFSSVGWSFVLVCFISWVILSRVAANYASLEKHFVTYIKTSKEILDGLSKAKKMFDIEQSTRTSIDDTLTVQRDVSTYSFRPSSGTKE